MREDDVQGSLIELTKADDPIVYHWGMGRHWYSLSTATQVKFEQVASSLHCSSLYKTPNRALSFENGREWIAGH